MKCSYLKEEWFIPISCSSVAYINISKRIKNNNNS
jgi:hypothetical protein